MEWNLLRQRRAVLSDAAERLLRVREDALNSNRASLQAVLNGAPALLDSLWDSAAVAVRRARSDRSFRCALLGATKAGKSTLLNSLLGEDVLPNQHANCTAVPTSVSFSAHVSENTYYMATSINPHQL